MLGRSALFLLAVFLIRIVASAQAVTPRSPLRLVPETPAAPMLPVIHFPRFPATGTEPVGLPAFARPAGMIFSGTVTRIERKPAHAGQAVATVMVTFRVNNAIRGVTPGDELTVVEWIGLWSAGQRYRLGEHLLLFLYPNSKLGLTSLVGGNMGRFAIDASGRVLLNPQQLSAFRTDSVLGGRSHVPFGDFALAVRRASEED